MSEEKKHYQRPLNFKTGKVEMNFGAGGKASAQLIADLFAKNFSNEFLDQGDDGARLPQPKGELIMATDSHVVSPIFFAGGDIGGLSIHGTVNDVAVCGNHAPLHFLRLHFGRRLSFKRPKTHCGKHGGCRQRGRRQNRYRRYKGC